MVQSPTTIAAVEHYVAYWLVMRGFNVTMIRGLTSEIDLLVSTPDGSHHRTYTH